MLAPLMGTDTVDEGHLLELVGGGEGNGVLPAVRGLFVDPLDRAGGAGRRRRRPVLGPVVRYRGRPTPGPRRPRPRLPNIQIHILLKVLHGECHPVERHLDLLDTLVRHRRDITHPLTEQGEHIRRQAPRCPEAGVIRPERDLRIRLGVLHRLDHRWVHLIQVVMELLGVLEPPHMVHRLNPPVRRPNQHQLEPEPVLPPHNTLLVLGIVGRGPEMPENHLRNPEVVLRVLGDINPVPVVLEGDGPIVRHRRIDIGHRPVVGDRVGTDFLNHTDDMVPSVDNTLIEQFIEPRDVFNLL